MNDKVRRLQSWVQNGKLENEGAEDSMRDIAVYSIIALVLLEKSLQAAAAATKGPLDPGPGDPTQWIKSFPPVQERDS